MAEIYWSPTARISFDRLLTFLESKWEKKVIEKLFSELNQALEDISRHPQLYPVISHSKHLRKCVLRKRTLLLYRIKNKNTVELVIFADARQNPKKYIF